MVDTLIFQHTLRFQINVETLNRYNLIFRPIRTFIAYPYESPRWFKEIKIKSSGPKAHYGPATLIRNSSVFTCGVAFNQQSTNDEWLDSRTNFWNCPQRRIRSQIKNIWKGRFFHTLVQDDQHIYLIGITRGRAAYALDFLAVFHLESSTWQMVHTKPDPQAPDTGYPVARQDLSCAKYRTLAGQTEIFIAGGAHKSVPVYLCDIWKLNLATMRWYLLKSVRLPENMANTEITINSNGLMYIFGTDRKPIHMRPFTYKLLKVWVTIPKLSEICWDGIVTIQPRLSSYPADTLRKLGIPDRFVDRLNRASGAKLGGRNNL